MKRKRWKWLFGTIQTERDADETLVQIGKGWFAIAALQTFLYVIFIFRGHRESSFLIMDVPLYLLAGYFLPRRKSRMLAIALFLYSILVLFLTIAARAGTYEGGKNIVLALLVLGMGYRGVKATFVYHRKSRTLWKHAAIVWGATAFTTLFIFIVSFVVVAWLHPDWETTLSDDQLGAFLIALILPFWVMCFLMLPKRFPLIGREASSASELGNPN